MKSSDTADLPIDFTVGIGNPTTLSSDNSDYCGNDGTRPGKGDSGPRKGQSTSPGRRPAFVSGAGIRSTAGPVPEPCNSTTRRSAWSFATSTKIRREDRVCSSCESRLRSYNRRVATTSASGQEGGLSGPPSSLVRSKCTVEPDVTISARFNVVWPDTRVRQPCKRRTPSGCCGCPTAGPPRARPGRPAFRLRRFRADPPTPGPRRPFGSP